MNSSVVELSMTFFLLAGLVAIAWAVVFINTRRRMQAEIDQLRSMIYEHMQKEREAPKPQPAIPPVAPIATSPPPEELSQETLAVIAAAVAAYLGKAVRVRGAHRLPQEEVSTWAQQGRVYIQASHNLEISHHA
jgi:methylmalonyl-CoA carboxyltransferase large subunit